MPLIATKELESVKTFQLMSIEELKVLKSQNFFKIYKTRITKKIMSLPNEIRELLTKNKNIDESYAVLDKRIEKAFEEIFVMLGNEMFPGKAFADVENLLTEVKKAEDELQWSEEKIEEIHPIPRDDWQERPNSEIISKIVKKLRVSQVYATNIKRETLPNLPAVYNFGHIPSQRECADWQETEKWHPTIAQSLKITEYMKMGYLAGFIYGRVWKLLPSESIKIEFQD